MIWLSLVLFSLLAGVGLAWSPLGARSAEARSTPPPKSVDGSDTCIDGVITYQIVSSNTGAGLLSIMNNCGETIVMGEIHYLVVQRCMGQTETFWPETDFFYALPAGALKTFNFSFFHECAVCEDGLPISWPPITIGDLGANVQAVRASAASAGQGQVRSAKWTFYIPSELELANDMYEGGCVPNVTPA